jgi:hypothetical protein
MNCTAYGLPPAVGLLLLVGTSAVEAGPPFSKTCATGRVGGTSGHVSFTNCRDGIAIRAIAIGAVIIGTGGGGVIGTDAAGGTAASPLPTLASLPLVKCRGAAGAEVCQFARLRTLGRRPQESHRYLAPTAQLRRPNAR